MWNAPAARLQRRPSFREIRLRLHLSYLFTASARRDIGASLPPRRRRFSVTYIPVWKGSPAGARKILVFVASSATSDGSSPVGSASNALRYRCSVPHFLRESSCPLIPYCDGSPATPCRPACAGQDPGSVYSGPFPCRMVPCDLEIRETCSERP